MTDVRKIKIDDFNYPLPESRIALHPVARRDSCKLLVANSAGRVSHKIFSDLPILIRPETLIVANETKVIRARMEFVKETGAKIEIFLLEPLNPGDYVTNFASCRQCSWVCLIGNKKRWKESSLSKILEVEGKSVTLRATMGETFDGNGVEVLFHWDDPSVSFAEVVEAAGNIPIPPYLNRESEESDTTDYQTVYSHTEGSVAAPTAGLHFTPELIDELRRYGNEFVTVTLHVGAGTFQPVKSEEIGAHPMHTEWISVSRHSLWRLIEALENGRDVLAVGTTSVRTLESLPYLGEIVGAKDAAEGSLKVDQWMPYEERYSFIDTIASLKKLLSFMDKNGYDHLEANTSIMIAPGFRWRIVNRLITNFHQPKSTLLLLVSSFLGGNKWKEIYSAALENDYRFLSYGDACLFSRAPQPVELPLAKSMVIRAATIRVATSPDNPSLEFRGGLCDDAEYYIKALRLLLESRNIKGSELMPVYIGEGAAPLRFFVALASSLQGAKVRVTCAEALQKRPIRPLIDTLSSLGADIKFTDIPGDWAIETVGRHLSGGAVRVDTSFTSQYLSALMMASLLWDKRFNPDNGSESKVSRPYVRMTERMLSKPDIEPEPDWSAAAFFYEYAFITKRKVTIAKLVPPDNSLQGDSMVCRLYSVLGVATEFNDDGSATLQYDENAFSVIEGKGTFEFDFNDYPDMVPSVAVALCYRRIPFRFQGVSHLRYKECDRLDALQRLLFKLGYEVKVEEDSLVFNGEFHPFEEFPVELDPFGDHRMAMAFYPLELLGMARILDKYVVRKSFPNFYQQF